jgi:hypothetical protein
MTGYQSKKAAAQAKLQCQCSMTTRLVGSGCQYCNPEYLYDDDAQPAQEPDGRRVQPDATMQSLKDLLRSVCDEVGKAAFAQPEQEPDVVMHCDSHTWTINNPPPKGSGDVSLYYAAQPAQRPWVGSGDLEDSNAYQTPPAQPAQERNFCPRCGKRTKDLTTIHTCTPPQETVLEKLS